MRCDLGDGGVRDAAVKCTPAFSPALTVLSTARAPSPRMELRLVKGSGPPRKSRPSTIRLREGLTIGRGADDQPVDVQLDCPGGRDYSQGRRKCL